MSAADANSDFSSDHRVTDTAAMSVRRLPIGQSKMKRDHLAPLIYKSHTPAFEMKNNELRNFNN
jgi:hypothetical protein